MFMIYLEIMSATIAMKTNKRVIILYSLMHQPYQAEFISIDWNQQVIQIPKKFILMK